MIPFLFSCNERLEESEVTLYRISNSFKAYTLFNPGSTWTYTNEATKQETTITIDSVVFYVGVNLIANTNEIDFQYEAFEMFLHEGNDMEFVKYEIAATNNKKEASNMTSLMRLFIGDKYHTAFQPNFYTGDTIDIGTVSGYYINLGFMQSYQVSGHLFENVFLTKVLDDFNPQGKEVLEFYFASNVGIVRFIRSTETNTEIWELTDWSVTQ